MFASAASLVAQQTPYQAYMDPVNQATNQLNATLLHLREFQIQKQIADEQHRHNLAEEAMEQRSLDSYRELHSNEAGWRQNQDVKDAIRACRETHADCAQLAGMMQVVSKALQPDWTQLTMAEYVECLYSVAKNASFAQRARDTALLHK